MEVYIVLVCIVVQGILTMAETALDSLRKTRLRAEAEKGNNLSQALLNLAEEPDIFLPSIRFGITSIVIIMAIYASDVFRGQVEGFLLGYSDFAAHSYIASLFFVILALIFFSLVFGDFLPKRLAENHPESVAKLLYYPLLAFLLLFQPIVWVFNLFGKLFLFLFRIKAQSDNQVTEEEIRALLQEGAETGVMDEIEQDIMNRAFHLGELSIGSLMTHRSDIVWIDVLESFETNMERLRSEPHTVYPVCQGSIDEVLGMVHLKDLYLNNIKSFEQQALKEILREPLFINEEIDAYTVLENFRTNRMHQSVVLDEYGTVLGMLTLNDILEALVGDISDTPEQEYRIISEGDDIYSIDGQYSFYDFLNHFDLNYSEYSDEYFKTVAGFLLNELRHIPKVGEQFEWKHFRFEIVQMNRSKIEKVSLQILEQNEEKEQEF